MVWYGNMLYAILYAKLWKQEKLCISGYISRPRRRWRAGGRQHNASAADSLRWPDSGAKQLSEPATAGGLRRPCARLDAQSGLQPRCSKHSVVAGRATTIAADSKSLHNLHSVALGALGEITWFETACATDQSQASLSWLMNYHAKTCNIVVDSATNSIKNTCCNSLQVTW